MKKQIAIYENNFLNNTDISHRTTLKTGFSGVGVLNMPSYHLGRKNPLWIYFVGLSHYGKKIIESVSLRLALDEARDLMKSLQNVIRRIDRIKIRKKKLK